MCTLFPLGSWWVGWFGHMVGAAPAYKDLGESALVGFLLGVYTIIQWDHGRPRRKRR